MQELENRIGHKFKNKKLLSVAITHSSYANESGGKFESYERLEFLGDSVLGLVTSDYIFKNCPNSPEGDLTKLRASLVCEKQLCVFSHELGIGDFVRLSKGERHSGGANRTSILADIFEAICAAIYLDAGIEVASKFILRFIVKAIKSPMLEDIHDYKTDLQEIVQKNPEETIKYALVKETGPDHDKRFTVEARINSNTVGVGVGRSKKEAQQHAAKKALELMGY